MHIRSYQPSDTAEIARLFHDTIHQINIRDYTPEQVEAWAPAEVDEARWAQTLGSRLTFVAVEGGRIVGFGELEADGHINRFYTHALHQGQGVGTALLGAIEDKARQLGLSRLFTEASITARPSFARRGFTVLREQEVVCRGVRFVNYRMEKTLA